jgi:hypothetical protein
MSGCSRIVKVKEPVGTGGGLTRLTGRRVR